MGYMLETWNVPTYLQVVVTLTPQSQHPEFGDSIWSTSSVQCIAQHKETPIPPECHSPKFYPTKSSLSRFQPGKGKLITESLSKWEGNETYYTLHIDTGIYIYMRDYALGFGLMISRHCNVLRQRSIVVALSTQYPSLKFYMYLKFL